MANPDILDYSVRRQMIEEISGNENIVRKRREQRKLDIYRNRHEKYVLERLEDEFSQKSIERMRKVLSINPCPRIINEMASLYTDEPKRSFTNVLNDNVQAQIDNLYEICRVNVGLRMANRYYKLHDQDCLWVIPKDGKIMVKPLTPKDYDVIPDADNPEKAFAYIINAWDRSLLMTADSLNLNEDYFSNDQINQKIGDENDDKAQYRRYVVWTKEWHYVMDGEGNYLSEPVPNPIGMLPFIDIASDKDHSFFVLRGNSVPEFTVDFLSQLSDLANISRLQGYSQAIVYSTEEPKSLNIGPNKVLWLKKDPNNSGADPSFEFASPSPDLNGSHEILNSQLKIFLSSLGLDSNVISGKGEARTFSSGVDHLLSQLDKFRASKQDMDLFRWVEMELFDLLRAWSNLYQTVTGPDELVEELRQAIIPDDVYLQVKFMEPTSIQTEAEKEASTISLLENGLMSRREAVSRIYGVDEERALEILEEIDEDSVFPKVEIPDSPENSNDQVTDEEPLEEEIDAEGTESQS